MTDKHFRDWESHYLGYGYGTGEAAILPALKRFFETLANRRSYDYRKMEAEFGPLATWLLINFLGHQDLIEYGTSPRFGWLTPMGETLRDYIASRTDDQLYSVVCDRDEGDVYCFPDRCQCDAPCKNPMFES